MLFQTVSKGCVLEILLYTISHRSFSSSELDGLHGAKQSISQMVSSGLLIKRHQGRSYFYELSYDGLVLAKAAEKFLSYEMTRVSDEDEAFHAENNRVVGEV